VSADPESPAARGLQADLNAAANIGLRALLDPDFPGRWWYVPCDAATGRPAGDKCTGAACLDLEERLIECRESRDNTGSRGKSKSREKINAWRDVGGNGPYRTHAQYWNEVMARVVDHLRAFNGLNQTAGCPLATGRQPW